MSVHLEPGRFYAGVSLPFFITRAMVTHKLESLGFTNVSFHDRDQSASLAVDPQKSYPGYSDDWSEWIEADYSGPKKDLAFEKHWAWLLVVPTKTGGVPSAPPSKSGPNDVPDLTSKASSAAGLAVVGVLVVVLGLLLRKA